MKKALALCAAACYTSLWLLPAAAAAAGTADRRFLATGGVGLRRASFHEAASTLSVDRGPLDDILKKAKAKKEAAAKEAARIAKAKLDAELLAKAQREAALRAAAMKAQPAPAPVVAPAPVPAPAPAPAPAPWVPPPIPPCNWTYDWEGVPRPAVCMNISDGNITCVRSANLTFADEITTCVPPALQRCENPTQNGQFPEDNQIALYSLVGVKDATIQHGQEFDIVCSDEATAVDHRYPLEAWGQDWYPGIQKVAAVCNNGTIIRMTPTNMTFWPGHPFYKPPGISPRDLRCALKEKVSLTQDDVSYLRWSEPRMVEAESRGYKWIDMDAILHKKLLKDAMNQSSHIEMAARNLGELREIPELKRVIKALIDNRMIPRGETMSQNTCKDLEKHWLYQLENSDPFKKANNIGYANWVPPVNATIGFPLASDVKLQKPVSFSCSYSMQKSPAGFDPYTRQLNYRYRDGCFCESGWTGGCPFRAELRPNFQTFGFDAVEIKMVSTAVGAATNALCWYFTKPANPEWGYLRTDTGYTYQAPLKNVTELKRDWINLRKLAQKARFKRT